LHLGTIDDDTQSTAASSTPFAEAPPPFNDQLLAEFLWQNIRDGQWTRLPGEGVHYAGLFHEQVWFSSRTFGIEYFPLSQTDVLKWCPAKHVWPYCNACWKFHFPPTGPNSHANSRKHLRKLGIDHEIARLGLEDMEAATNSAAAGSATVAEGRPNISMRTEKPPLPPGPPPDNAERVTRRWNKAAATTKSGEADGVPPMPTTPPSPMHDGVPPMPTRPPPSPLDDGVLPMPARASDDGVPPMPTAPALCCVDEVVAFGGRLGVEVVVFYWAEDKLQICADDARRQFPRLDGCHITLDVYKCEGKLHSRPGDAHEEVVIELSGGLAPYSCVGDLRPHPHIVKVRPSAHIVGPHPMLAHYYLHNMTTEFARQCRSTDLLPALPEV